MFTASNALQGSHTPRIKRDGDFKDLVTQSTVFADKSLFIKDVIEDSDTTLLLAMPRRWGKTVILDMTKRFLEILVDDNGKVLDETAKESTDNYQIFHEDCVLQPDGQKSQLAISRSKITIQDDPKNIFKRQEVDALEVQGTYPVIYIDFKSCKASDYDSVKEAVKRVLRECFTIHSYLGESANLVEEKKLEVKKYMSLISSKSLSEDEIKPGMQVLSKALHAHHKKKVWILIDEYDAVANVAYRDFSEKDLQDTINLFAGIYETALESNPYLEKGILTGVQYISQSGMLSGLNNLGKYDFTSAKYAQHYGLDQGEVDLFFDHFSVPPHLGAKAKLWYNGYKVPKYSNNPAISLPEFISKYNVWSIVSYLKDGNFHEFKSHWEKSGSIDFLDALFANKEVRERVEQLVNSECIPLARIADFSVNNFKTLKTMLGGNKTITPDGVKVLFSYLFIGGYLTIDGIKPDHYRLPNMEITHEMGNRLITYYETTCTIDPDKIQLITDTLQQMMDVSETSQNRLEALLPNFYNRFREVIRSIHLVNGQNEEGVFVNEDITHFILNYIALQAQHNTLGSEIYMKFFDSDKKGRVNLKVAKGNIGAIIEVKCVPTQEGSTQHITEALKQAKSYRNVFDTDNNIFLAINVAKQTSPSEQRNIELLCAAELFGEDCTLGIDASGAMNASKSRRIS